MFKLVPLKKQIPELSLKLLKTFPRLKSVVIPPRRKLSEQVTVKRNGVRGREIA